MGWATLTLRKVALKQDINDLSLEQIQKSSEQQKLSNFSSAIADGNITPAEIASLGTGLFGDALDFMEEAQAAAKAVAEDQTTYYTSAYENLTAEQYASSGLSSQASLYFDPETGALDEDAIYENFYEENLKEYAEEIMPELNEKQKEIEQKLTDLQTQLTAKQSELEQLNNSIDQQIQDNTIKLS